MQNNRLLRFEEIIIRILSENSEKALIIDCLRQSTPKWINKKELADYEVYPEELLKQNVCPYDNLTQQQRRIAHEYFTLIAGILPFIEDDRQRCFMINAISANKQISKQTIRHYLWMYLVYQDIAALAPKEKPEKPLTEHEKNMRWALNKYFYTRNKNTLTTAYMFMLKDKYCDETGVLLPNHPTIHQFRYFYKKYNKLQTYYISRGGIKDYQRNHRPLLGDSTTFASCIGTGFLDSTIIDIYLVDDAGNLIGRPILTACIDSYSGLCCGYFLSWEGGTYSLRGLMLNVIADKKEWCQKFGITIQAEDWNCNNIPATLVTDKGSEYVSGNFEQLSELGVTIVNLPSFRAELKGKVEKFFDIVQSSYKKHLKGKGVLEPDFQERGVHDYRKDACLTLSAFERIIIHCILYYNSNRIVEDFPFTKEMLSDNVKPYASHIWNYSKNRSGTNLISVSQEELILTLLPRTTGKFGRTGLIVNKLRYKHGAFTERYLSGGSVTVAYNPDDVSCIWLFENGIYTQFLLAESRFIGETQAEVESILAEQKARNKALERDFTQAKIDLARHIDAIANTAVPNKDTNIKQVRHTRKREQRNTHIDYTKDVVQNG